MREVVQIRLFGAFAVRVGVTPVPEGAWRLRKAKSLVKLLALAPERRVHRERAMELLWPELAPGAAANNFHQALYVARRALEGAGADAPSVLPLRDEVLTLDPAGGVEVDIELFEAAAGRARETGVQADYHLALALHGGELLPEDRYESWTAARREALHESYLALLLELSELLARDGDTAAAIDALQHVVVDDPLHEPAHRALMRQYASAGRRQQALAQYHHLRDALRRELAAEPDGQTTGLYRALLRGEDPTAPEPQARAQAPRARALRPVRRHNLPIALTSFIGRERELGEVARLLDRHRLLTLTGAGGAGKTRLALEAATARVNGPRDGVWLVELAGLSDSAAVPEATATALGLTLAPQRPALDGLAAELAGWDALLVLDNCEHLVTACAVLAERLLASCPDLRVLATSREPLRIPGEATWRVPSLARAESIRLFCERASEVVPGFELGEDNEQAVAELCARLDGMPLALELAAARVAALSPAQIAERLDDALAVLTAGRRSGLDRQQTLRATLTWSHDLLTADERALFRRLGVFAGGFTLEAAEAVDGGDGVADRLGRLVDKSLVTADEDAGHYRYRLLEPMRQYARERLGEAGETAALEERHEAFYSRLAAAADPEGEARVPVDRLEADHDNLRAALTHALRHDPGRALRLAVHMWPMWMAGSHFGEGRRRLEAVLGAAPEPTELRAEALRALCGLEMRLGRASALPALGDERVAIYRALGDQAEVAHALDEVGVYEYMTGDYDRAERLYAESDALAQGLGDGRVAAAVAHSLGVLAHCRGDFEGAREALLTSLSGLRRLPDGDRSQFFRVHTVGLFVAGEGPGGAPRMYFEETAQFFRRVDARRAIGYVLAGLGDVSRAQGVSEPARERLGESLEHFREAHDPMGVAFALNRLGILAGVTGQHELGREWLEEAFALRRELGDRRGAGMTIGNLGVLAARAGDPQGGRAIVVEALEEFEDTEDAPGRMGMRLNLANLAADAGELARARELYEESYRLADAQRLFRTVAWIGLTLAELAIAERDGERARRLLGPALEQMRALGDRWGVARALELGQAAAKTPLSPARDG